MIISASRRTDIPALYADWMLHRVRAGYCEVPNPMRPSQVSRISLRVADVDAIVFWTRNPRPLLPHLAELDARGFRYYFQYTILGYPPQLDPKSPPVLTAVETFRELSAQLNPSRVIWRYDPIVFSGATPPAFHGENYQRLAALLRGYTSRSVVSIVDAYRKTERRMQALAGTPAELQPCAAETLAAMMRQIADSAQANGMEIVSCAEPIDLRPFGIRPGKCIDEGILARACGVAVSPRKDPAQREHCGCVVSRDIGMYDSCVYGCRYCYATSSFDQAKLNLERHDPLSASLI